MQALEGDDWSPVRRRSSRMARAYELRLRGDLPAFAAAMSQELALARAHDDQQLAWAATIGLALAEIDQGQDEAALGRLAEATQEVRAFGRLSGNLVMVAVLAALMLERGRTGAGRERLESLLQTLRVQQALWMVAPALPWRALLDARLDDAARLVGWSDAWIARLGERPGPYFTRVRDRCEQRLRAELGEARYRQLRDAGQALDADTGMALALA